MSHNPSTHHEIALLRHEERLVRAALANAHPPPATGARDRRAMPGLDRLFGVLQARLGARRSGGALRAPRLQS